MRRIRRTARVCKPLAAAVLAWCGASAANAFADTIVVANCNDSGAGSLRDAVLGATSGDTIDLSQLTCSRISLTTGEISVGQQDLSLSAYSDGGTPLRADGRLSVPPVTIDAQNNSRVLHHLASGTLSIVGLSLRNGRMEGADGGCVYSLGNVSLRDSDVSNCQAIGTSVGPNGSSGGCGGGFAAKAVTVERSTITHNQSLGLGPRGGGICVNQELHLSQSVVSDNSAYTVISSPVGSGGGIWLDLRATSDIAYSTIARNVAASGGAIWATAPSGSYTRLNIQSSTISGNSAAGGNSAMSFGAASLGVYNSTITANNSQRAAIAAVKFYGTATIASTIIAGNLAQGAPCDLDDVSKQAPLGNRDLIAAALIPVPPGTITDDAQLAPLADNGGPTPTHALLADSPAIDAGINPFGARCDQRYIAQDCYPRQAGTATDIGAFEFGAQRNAIFADGFE